MASFRARLDKIKKFELDDELKAHLLLRQNNLDFQVKNIVLGSAGGNYALHILHNNVRSSFRVDGLPDSSMTTTHRGITQPRKSNKPQGTTSQLQTLSSLSYMEATRVAENNEHLLLTYDSNDLTTLALSTVVHSVACASVIGEKTAESALNTYRWKILEMDIIKQTKHHFGLSTTPWKTVCVVRVTLTRKREGSAGGARFKIRFDIISRKASLFDWALLAQGHGSRS